MATPQQHVYTDPTVGMELTSDQEVALEATRWLFQAGDWLDPHRKEDLDYLRRGGEETANVCLRRTNGYLPRCLFTPLEVWCEWLPLEFFPEGSRPLQLKGQPIPDQNPNGKTLVNKPLYGYAHYPGELIVDALGIPTGEKNGTVEIEVLRGVDHGNKDAIRLNDLFWSDFDPVATPQIRLIEEHIQRVAGLNPSPDVVSAARDQLLSCEQFRRSALTYIDRCHSQLDQRQSHQHIYSYSPKVRSLLVQLEIKPRQQQSDISGELLKVVANSGLTPEVLTQMQARDENLVSKLGEMFAQSLATAIASLQPAPTDPPKPKSK